MNWYNFLVKIKPDGKAFRSILYTKILLEVIANAIKYVQDYAILIINDQVWYVNDNFDPEPWEDRYQINVPDFSTLEERRELVKSYMLFPQYSNRLSLDYFQIQLNNSGYDSVVLKYNTKFVSTSSVRFTTINVSAGQQDISISGGGYSDDSYGFIFQAYDSNGYQIYPKFISNSPAVVTVNMPQSGTIILLTLKPNLSDPLKITTETVSKGLDVPITIPGGGYIDTTYDIQHQAFDNSGNSVIPTFKSKTNTEVLFDIPQDCIITLLTARNTSDDLLNVTTEQLSAGQQEIVIPNNGYLTNDYELIFQAYGSNGYRVYPIFEAKTPSTVILNMPQLATVTLMTFGVSNEGNESSFMHSNDFADEKLKFDIGELEYNSFIAEGEISANLYKNVISLLLSLKPPQVVLYDKIEVLQAIALDDNLAIALDDNLAIALTVL